MKYDMKIEGHRCLVCLPFKWEDFFSSDKKITDNIENGGMYFVCKWCKTVYSI